MRRSIDGERRAQTIAVLHQHMPAKTGPGLFALAFPIQHALRIGPAPVGPVAALLPPEVHARIARILLLGRLEFPRVAAVFADEAFQAGPRFAQRAVNGEVFVAAPAFPAGELIDFGEEAPGRLRRKPAPAVLGEHAVVEAALAELPACLPRQAKPRRRQVQKPQSQQIITELFAEEPLAADTVKRHQEADPAAAGLGRDAGPAHVLVELVKQGRESLERGIDVALDRAQGMLSRHAVVCSANPTGLFQHPASVGHRPKLEKGERLATKAWAYLPEQYRPTHGQPDAQGNHAE